MKDTYSATFVNRKRYICDTFQLCSPSCRSERSGEPVWSQDQFFPYPCARRVPKQNTFEVSMAQGKSCVTCVTPCALARQSKRQYNFVWGPAEVDRQTIDWYDKNAEDVTRRYESVPGGISDFFRFVFAPGDNVLEIGSGTGRDAARLLELGVYVHAVEPSAGLRHRAAVLHPELSGRLFEGELPADLPPPLAGPYDGVVLSAVIMHIPDSELFDAALAVRDRLKDGGKLLLSTPLERGDTPAGSDRDESGRLMILRPASQVRLLFERLGFILKSEWTSGDAAGRSDVLWVTMHFQYSRSTARPIDRIESILNADKKVATYKLALIRALCDIALTAHARARWEPDGRVSIPITDLAERWVLFYWPLVDSRELIPQINGESTGGKPIAFRSALSELAGHFSRQGGLNGFAWKSSACTAESSASCQTRS
jgi:SAM-dependent methyltransferase